MAKAYEILEMLLPDGGWIVNGNNFEGIEFINCEPITKKQFEDGFAKYDAWLIEQAEAKATERQVILDRLGLTAEEAQLLLGGN
jgi:hypothetical protein